MIDGYRFLDRSIVEPLKYTPYRGRRIAMSIELKKYDNVSFLIGEIRVDDSLKLDYEDIRCINAINSDFSKCDKFGVSIWIKNGRVKYSFIKDSVLIDCGFFGYEGIHEIAGKLQELLDKH